MISIWMDRHAWVRMDGWMDGYLEGWTGIVRDRCLTEHLGVTCSPSPSISSALEPICAKNSGNQHGLSGPSTASPLSCLSLRPLESLYQSISCAPRLLRLWFQQERGGRRGLAQRGAQPQLAALCPAPARCERPGKRGKTRGKRGKRGWGRGGKLSARETAAFWRETAALRREMQPRAGTASGMLPGAAEHAQAAGMSRTPAMLFQDFVSDRSKGFSQEGQQHGAGDVVGAELLPL